MWESIACAIAGKVFRKHVMFSPRDFCDSRCMAVSHDEPLQLSHTISLINHNASYITKAGIMQFFSLIFMGLKSRATMKAALKRKQNEGVCLNQSNI